MLILVVLLFIIGICFLKVEPGTRKAQERRSQSFQVRIIKKYVIVKKLLTGNRSSWSISNTNKERTNAQMGTSVFRISY